jgi:hypothetical protein
MTQIIKLFGFITCVLSFGLFALYESVDIPVGQTQVYIIAFMGCLVGSGMMFFDSLFGGPSKTRSQSNPSSSTDSNHYSQGDDF